AVERGKAFLAAGATCVFVPGKLDEQQVGTLVDAFGERRLSVIAVPGSLSVAKLTELGVARISYGPFTQRVALTALADLGTELYGGGELPANVRALN
ncbi:MAG: isocitrate lyase/phosphoenolpyruvate mutase family protein, partial [Solirubrobacteraceae bacterium]|nr:isocitrate lyase/phosphoenolpyruvate mutase family protein [Solirubrobacteraceae bacterium]